MAKKNAENKRLLAQAKAQEDSVKDASRLVDSVFEQPPLNLDDFRTRSQQIGLPVVAKDIQKKVQLNGSYMVAQMKMSQEQSDIALEALRQIPAAQSSESTIWTSITTSIQEATEKEIQAIKTPGFEFLATMEKRCERRLEDFCVRKLRNFVIRWVHSDLTFDTNGEERTEQSGQTFHCIPPPTFMMPSSY